MLHRTTTTTTRPLTRLFHSTFRTPHSALLCLPALLCLLALAAALSLRAQTPAAPAAQPAGAIPPLTLGQCIAMALDKNYDLRIQRITTAAAANAIETAKAAYDPNLTGRFNHGYNRNDPLRNSDGHATSLEAGVSQKLITGATLQVGYGTDYHNPRAGSGAFGSGLTLSVRQPVLKNYGSEVNKAAIERARLAQRRSIHDLKADVLDTIRAVESAYYSLAFARANLEVLKSSLVTAQTLHNENKKRLEIGVGTDLNVLQAQVGVANAQRAIVNGQKYVKDAEDTLLSLINPFQFQTAIGPLDAVEIAPADISFDRSYKLARDNSPALASMRLSIQQSELDLTVARRNRLPQLDVVGSAGYDASRASFGRAVGNTLSHRSHDWSIGATLTYPIGSRAEKAALANAKASLDSNQVALEKLDQNVLLQVRTAIRAVQASEESVRISALAATLSEEQYNKEKARYDQGLSTFRFVQDMRQDLDNARVAELNARVSLRLALADLARLEGSSLDRYQIKLDDTPAP